MCVRCAKRAPPALVEHRTCAVYSQLRILLDLAEFHDRFGELRFASRREQPGLQAADLLAYECYSMSSMSMTSSAAAEIARAPQKRLRSLSGAPRDFGIENDHTKRAYNRVLGDARRSKGVADTSIWKKKTCSPSTIPSAARRANRRNRIAWRHPVKRRRAKLESNSPRDNRCDSSRTMSRGGAAAPPRLAPCTPPRLAPCTHLTKT